MLLQESPHEKKRGRRGSVVTVEGDQQVHDACYLLWQHAKESECCHDCGKGLWVLVSKSKSFQRRASVTQEDVHLCETCATKYHK